MTFQEFTGPDRFGPLKPGAWFSKFCARSGEPEEAAGLKKTHAPINNAIATQEAAACQSPRTHKTHWSAPVRDASNAITRLSKV